MSDDTNKDNVVNLNQPEPDTEASEQAHIVPYTQISNEFLRDPSLPPETRLLLVYLLSFAPRWKFHDSVIRKEMGAGRDKLERMFRELRAAGYVKNFSIRNAKGLVVGSKRIFSRIPEFLKAEKPSPAENHRGPEKAGVGQSHRGPENPGPEKAGVIKNNKDLFKKNNKKIYKKDFDEEFNEFWEQYPKKVDKHKASMIYQKLLEKEGIGLHAVVMIAICGQVGEREIKEELGMWLEPMKHPTTWLNGRCWGNPFKTGEKIHEEFERSNKKSTNRSGGLSRVDQQLSTLDEFKQAALRKQQEIRAEISRLESEGRGGD